MAFKVNDCIKASRNIGGRYSGLVIQQGTKGTIRSTGGTMGYEVKWSNGIITPVMKNEIEKV